MYPIIHHENNWVHKGIDDTMHTYHIELEEPQDRHVCNGFVQIDNLVIDALKNCMILN